MYEHLNVSRDCPTTRLRMDFLSLSHFRPQSFGIGFLVKETDHRHLKIVTPYDFL